MAKFYRLNEHIQAPQLRVIDSKGEQLGVLSRSDALAKAKESGQDLIEIAASAQPPVAKIADFQKFRYEENKKERASKKGASAGELKELWLSPRIADHDLKVRLARTEEFLKNGHKVKLTVKFKGREMAHQDIGYKVLQEALTLLGEKVAVEKDPKMEGRKLSMIVGKGKGGHNAETKNEQVST
ncbi:translation initiation factor IF-3 [Candidatus Daviesbacteria bacterium]|nr:translation initiation factor IF-3 [Candidatus Daviesbacteria bacterium]